MNTDAARRARRPTRWHGSGAPAVEEAEAAAWIRSGGGGGGGRGGRLDDGGDMDLEGVDDDNSTTAARQWDLEGVDDDDSTTAAARRRPRLSSPPMPSVVVLASETATDDIFPPPPSHFSSAHPLASPLPHRRLDSVARPVSYKPV
ncbi:hypothetical protein OsI_03003 [Oryza sativa Indica Group]|nr:hypothetical protein OsI_03003 [Oryza sativa Indica Group]EAZ12845.1 hypothetical protein OsJ_02765 [Oryza sativa Japonica Group]